MASLTLDYESIRLKTNYDVLVTEFENGMEQRRLRQPKRRLAWHVTSPALTEAQKAAWIAFFSARSGAYKAFDFYCPTLKATYSARFVPDSFSVDYEHGYWRCEFDMVRVV